MKCNLWKQVLAKYVYLDGLITQSSVDGNVLSNSQHYKTNTAVKYQEYTYRDKTVLA